MTAIDEHPTTSMLAFACLDDVRAASFQEDGIRWTSLDRSLSFDFASARAYCGAQPGKLYVVDVYAAAAAGCDPREFVPPEALVNARPYRAPEAVTAGGGIVTRRETGRVDVLLIYRRGAWDLPKGKLDPAESIRGCALREVREEVGIREVRIRRALGETIHGYPDGTRYAVKTTYWFEMETPEERFEPQEAEDIEKVRWVSWKDAAGLLGYETLRRHLDRVEPLILGAGEAE